MNLAQDIAINCPENIHIRTFSKILATIDFSKVTKMKQHYNGFIVREFNYVFPISYWLCFIR